MFNEGSRNTLYRKQHLFKTISLSANTVADRVNDLAGDIQCELKEKCKDFVAYSVAIDESKLQILRSLLFLFEMSMDFQLVWNF
jgi:hypothetical protein